MEILNQIKEICNGIDYSRNVPEKAIELAKQNNCVIIVGGSDDLMYCFGADSYMTDHCEHGEGWDGCDLAKDASEEELRKEANQLGLKIFWCGKIYNTGEFIKNYDSAKKGAFSYTVKDGIKSIDFTVFEDKDRFGEDDVYCTGIIFKLPEDFIRS